VAWGLSGTVERIAQVDEGVHAGGFLACFRTASSAPNVSVDIGEDGETGRSRK